MIPEIRPYENGSSEPNSLHLHTYPKPSDKSVLLSNLSWDVLTDGREWMHRRLTVQEPVPSRECALERANQFAVERGIPVLVVEHDDA